MFIGEILVALSEKVIPEGEGVLGSFESILDEGAGNGVLNVFLVSNHFEVPENMLMVDANRDLPQRANASFEGEQ